MLEVFKRERWNQAYTWEQSAVLLGSILGSKPEALTGVVQQRKKILLERLLYTYYGAESLISDLQARLDALQTDQDMFDRLESM